MNLVKIAKLKKITNIIIDYCMHTYGAKNSDCEIHILPIPNESQFNAGQTFLLYGSLI